MDVIEKEIVEWHKATFPNATFNAKLHKLNEECIELLSAVCYGDIQHALEEVADVFIVAVALAADKREFEENVSMTRIISDKMEINRRRTWGKETKNGDRPRVK